MIKKTVDGQDQFETALIEVNDGYSLGCYEGLPDKDYVDMLIARWQQLMSGPQWSIWVIHENSYDYFVDQLTFQRYLFMKAVWYATLYSDN